MKMKYKEVSDTFKIKIHYRPQLILKIRLPERSYTSTFMAAGSIEFEFKLN